MDVDTDLQAFIVRVLHVLAPKRSLLQVSELSQIHPLCPITTSMAHLARPIVVKRLTSNINIFIDEDICFAIAELTLVKDADFHHFAHLLSRKQKKPASEETGK
jgi:hypothetical protein